MAVAMLCGEAGEDEREDGFGGEGWEGWPGLRGSAGVHEDGSALEVRRRWRTWRGPRCGR